MYTRVGYYRNIRIYWDICAKTRLGFDYTDRFVLTGGPVERIQNPRTRCISKIVHIDDNSNKTFTCHVIIRIFVLIR